MAFVYRREIFCEWRLYDLDIPVLRDAWEHFLCFYHKLIPAGRFFIDDQCKHTTYNFHHHQIVYNKIFFEYIDLGDLCPGNRY